MMTAERDGTSYPDAHLLIFNVLSRVRWEGLGFRGDSGTRR